MKDSIDRFYEQLGSRCCNNDPVGVETFLLDCIENNAPCDDAEYMVTVCGELGSFYRNCEQYDHSLAAFERAKTVAENAGAAESTLYAATLNNMAGTYRLMRDFDRAIDLYLAARKRYHNICGRTSVPYIGSLNNLSLAYREAGRSGMALACLEEAVDLIDITPSLRFTLGAVFSNLGTLYYSIGDREQALRCMNRSLQEYEKCPHDDRWHYVDALSSMGGVLYALGNYWQAASHYRKAAAYTMQCSGKTLAYAKLCQHIRWCCESLGRPDQAIVPLKEAVEIYTRILGSEHERTRAAADDLRHLQQRNKSGMPPEKEEKGPCGIEE